MFYVLASQNITTLLLNRILIQSSTTKLMAMERKTNLIAIHTLDHELKF